MTMVGPHNTIDTRVFWASQYILSVVWIVFAVIALFSLSGANLTVCIVASVLSITNTLGYIRCDKNH